MVRVPHRPAPTDLRTVVVRAIAGLILSVALLMPGGDWSAVAQAEAATGGQASSTPSSKQKSSATAKKSKSGTTSTTKRVRKSSTGSGKSVAKTTTKKSSKKTYSKKSYGSKRYSKSRRRGSAGAAHVPSGGVRARAALVIDANTGEVLYDKNSGTPMPIASLTKMMTALVFLETKPDLSKRVMVSREDLAGAGRSQLRRGEVVSLRDLLHSALLSSDNAATRALVRNSGIEPEEFLARMNRKADVMGLSQTHFVEFTGLSEQNVSTAQEYAQVLKTAGTHPLIAHITTLPDYTYRTTVRDHHLVNTNRLARYGVFDVKGGKTGFISKSGYCLATWVTAHSREVISVVLGAPSNSARFSETQRLIDRVAVPPSPVVARGV